VIERDEDHIGRLLRRMPRREPGKQLRSACPDEEVLAAYLSGGLGETGNAELENHLAACAYCLDDLLAAYRARQSKDREEVPANAVARAMALLAKPKLTSEIFSLVVGLARESLELISTTGRLVTPSLAAEIRGKGKAAGDGMLRIEKDLGELQVALEVERLEGNLCQVAVNATLRGGPATDLLRLSLCSGGREQASFLARQGSATFDRVAPGEYQLVVAAAGSALGAIALTIKEAGHE
jgi:hypothetical protein